MRPSSEIGCWSGCGRSMAGRGGAFWADIGGGASGSGRWAESRQGDAAALDAGGRVMEPGAAAATAPASAGAQGALWRVGADGRELSRVAGGSRSARMSDGSGGRRDEHDAGAVGGGRNDLGGGGGVARLD